MYGKGQHKGEIMSDPIFKRILNIVYPIGSIYLSVNNTSPAILFGGTWEQVKGRFLMGTGVPDGNTDNYFGAMSVTQYNAALGSKGGQDYHTLNSNEMPSHNHRIPQGYTPNASENTSGDYMSYGGWNSQSNSVSYFTPTNYAGGGQKHNNMPPYLAVNIWKRTA